MSEARQAEGSVPAIPRDRAHRFTQFFKRRESLTSWARHFERHGVPYVLEEASGGWAIWKHQFTDPERGGKGWCCGATS